MSAAQVTMRCLHGRLLLAKRSTSTASTAEASKASTATTTTAAPSEAAPVAVDAALAKCLHILLALFGPELLAAFAGRLVTVLELAGNVVKEA
jgi:hypothetical protein